MSESIPEDLFVGEPVIEARWRLQNSALPLKNRHLRAFTARGVSKALSSWARQHIEWTLAEGSMDTPNGVLVIDVDSEGRAVMSVEPYEALPAMSAELLVDRASGQQAQAVEDEVIWTCRDGQLYVSSDADKPLSGANSLIADLACTLHREPVYEGHADPAQVMGRLAAADECFLVSDEHGVVTSSDHDGPVGRRFAACYAKLVAQAKPDRMDVAAGAR